MDRTVTSEAIENTRTWLRKQAWGDDMLAMVEKLNPADWVPAMTGVRHSLDGGAPAANGRTLTAPAGVAKALGQWVRRARIEIKYLPRDSDRRKQLAQAAYVTEILVRGVRVGAAPLPYPTATYAGIQLLLKMIELNQDIRFSVERSHELDLVRPWLRTWETSMVGTVGATSFGTTRYSRPARPAPVEKRYLNNSLHRFYVKLVFGIFISALPVGISAFLLPEAYRQRAEITQDHELSVTVALPDPGSVLANTVAASNVPKFRPAAVVQVPIPIASPARPSAHRPATARRPSARPLNPRPIRSVRAKMHRAAAAQRSVEPSRDRRAERPAPARNHTSHIAPSLF